REEGESLLSMVGAALSSRFIHRTAFMAGQSALTASLRYHANNCRHAGMTLRKPAMSATVLVVEDEPAIQELLQVSLAGAGYKVLAAMDASQAHAIMEQALPDVIVLDWMLPGMSGMALAKTLRNQSRTHHIPIIMLT